MPMRDSRKIFFSPLYARLKGFRLHEFSTRVLVDNVDKKELKSLIFQGKSAIGRKREVFIHPQNVENVENFSPTESFTFPFFEGICAPLGVFSPFFDLYISALVFRAF